MAVARLARLAALAPVPVFALAGVGARDRVQDLALDAGVVFVRSPRHATLLVLAGRFPVEVADVIARIHDQVPSPRATVWWGLPEDQPVPEGFPPAVAVPPERSAAEVLVQVHRELIRGERDPEPTLLPHVPPSPWKGVGPYGQGGEGMMGGTPYGRPMAMPGPDRDGLELDRLRLRIGPYFPAFPSGLVLDVVLQGDVVQEVDVVSSPFAGTRLFPESRTGPRPFQPATVEQVERARAESHLRWVARALGIHGLHALGRRVVRLAQDLRPEGVADVRRMRRRLERNPTLRWATAGVGVIGRDQLAADASGPVARASGIAADRRISDPVYERLGFEPVVHDGGDAWARWRQRLAEAEQSLDLAQRAHGTGSSLPGRVEGPRGEQADSLVDLLPVLLPGMEWGDVVTTVASLDLDLVDAPAQRPAGVA